MLSSSRHAVVTAIESGLGRSALPLSKEFLGLSDQSWGGFTLPRFLGSFALRLCSTLVKDATVIDATDILLLHDAILGPDKEVRCNPCRMLAPRFIVPVRSFSLTFERTSRPSEKVKDHSLLLPEDINISSI